MMFTGEHIMCTEGVSKWISLTLVMISGKRTVNGQNSGKHVYAPKEQYDIS